VNDATGEALLKGVLQVPEDDNARLIYADWLQENGREDEGEFIRMQCGVGRYDDESFQKTARAFFRKQKYPIKGTGNVRFAPPDLAIKGVSPHFVARRGFVDEIELSCDSFLAHAATLFAAHPISRVRLADKRPNSSIAAGWHAWTDPRTFVTAGGPFTLPPELWDGIYMHVKGRPPAASPGFRPHPGIVYFTSVDDANQALSEVCLIHGWRAAGLIAPSPAPEKPTLEERAEQLRKKFADRFPF
jgi:uncharacterized protein (TIGR02996 family)